jgi:hypothetical protein
MERDGNSSVVMDLFWLSRVNWLPWRGGYPFPIVDPPPDGMLFVVTYPYIRRPVVPVNGGL